MKFRKSTCLICGAVQRGEFRSDSHYCGLHKSDEIDFLMSLPAGKLLTKEQKTQRAIYRRRWDTKARERRPA